VCSAYGATISVGFVTSPVPAGPKCFATSGFYRMTGDGDISLMIRGAAIGSR